MTVATTLDDLPAHSWHSQRRAELIQSKEVKFLMRGGSIGKNGERLVNFTCMVALFSLHVGLALYMQTIVASNAVWLAALKVFVLAATVGGQCAFVSQALNHESAHSFRSASSSLTFLIGMAAGQANAALCHVPWAAYYWGGGHARHHRFTGDTRDIDADALFFLWIPPRCSATRRFLWLSWAAIIIPVAYTRSLARFAMYNIRANVKEIGLVTFDFTCTIIAHILVGRAGAAYLFLSSCFSMGLLAHPLVGFWILQHYCARGAQPTVSYYGSSIWNWLCLNELLHVEHHDLSGMSWFNLPMLRKLKPEVYEGLHTEMSVFGLIYEWLNDTGDGVQWDFACRIQWARHMQRIRLLMLLQDPTRKRLR